MELLQELFQSVTPAAYIAASLTFAYVTLMSLIACVATFARGRLSKKAYRVLKILTRWRPGPPGPGSSG